MNAIQKRCSVEGTGRRASRSSQRTVPPELRRPGLSAFVLRRSIEHDWICPRVSGVRVLESGSVVGAEVAVLVLGWGEHAKGRVAASAVVEELDVVVDRGGQLDAGLPGFAVEQLDLHAAPE